MPQNGKEKIGGLYMIVLGAILILMGVIMLIRPVYLWYISESWKTNDGDGPTGLYLWSTRFGGVMMTLAGSGVIVAAFL